MKITAEDTARFCRGMALLLHAGVGVTEGIFLLAEEEDGEYQSLLKSLGEKMDFGETLSDALQQSDVFPQHVVGMVRIGEASGRMEETLESLAAFYEERQRISRQIRSALTYPCMLLLLMMAVIAVLLVKVLPVFDEVYASLGGHLTGIGAGLLHLGQILKGMMPVLLLLLVVLAAAGVVFALYLPAREKVMALVMKRFGDRGIMRKFNNAHFSRALAMTLSSGLSLEEAVELSQSLLSDVPGAVERCAQCAADMEKGEDIAAAMGKADLLTPAQSRMLAVGIRGGNADQMMEDIAEKLAEDASASLESLISKVEPTMVLIASLLVGAILLAVMLPLMNIMRVIG